MVKRKNQSSPLRDQIVEAHKTHRESSKSPDKNYDALEKTESPKIINESH